MQSDAMDPEAPCEATIDHHPPGPAKRLQVVVSAVNLVEGGALTVLRECLAAAASALSAEWDIVALVNRSDLISQPRVRTISIPSARTSWLKRLYWEWFGFRRMSQAMKPTLWLALHDITPRVVAGRQAVYCHNPSPFYRTGIREALLEPKFLLFTLFYSALYRLFIRRNYLVVVQQDWLRSEFKRRMGAGSVVVAHPVSVRANVVEAAAPLLPRDAPFIFLYPALPRVFKNFETLCQAARLLGARGVGGFEVWLTVRGDENRCARWLTKTYAAIPQVRLIGRQSAQEMKSRYSRADAVVFPSKLETWGLPISEGKALGLPLLVADLPYAHEAVGNYDRVSFFPCESASALADLMQSMIAGTWHPSPHRQREPQAPFASDWHALWDLLVEGLVPAADDGSKLPAVSARVPAPPRPPSLDRS
jgi:glycosyltransferase involved in cell wall biosynthesis